MEQIKLDFKNAQHILRFIQGDITEQSTDAIVNAANQDLILGAGVAGAIRRKGGSSIQIECNQIGKINIGEAAITTGGNLIAKHVIHAVGPIYQDHSEKMADIYLKNAVINSLKLLVEKNLLSITFPAISTGIFGFPKERAAKIIISSIYSFLKNTKKNLIVQICLYSLEDYNLFVSVWKNNIFNIP